MRIEIKLIILVTMLTTMPAWSSESNSAGIKAYRSGDYALAEHLFRQALSEETDNAKMAAVYRNLGLVYTAQGKDASECIRKADELNPPGKPVFIRDDGKSVLINNNQTPSTIVPAGHAQQSLIYEPEAAPNTKESGAVAEPQRVGDKTPNSSSPSNRKAAFGPGVYGGSAMSGFAAGGTYRLNQPGAANGGMFNGRFGESSRFDVLPGFSRNPGMIGGNGGSYFSSSTPNGNFEYSTNTPIVLPAANQGPVIINSPGPNIFSSQQGQDGSSTIIRKGTY